MQKFISKLFTITLFEAGLCLSIVVAANIVYSSFIWYLNDAAVIAVNMIVLLILAYAMVFQNRGAHLTHTSAAEQLLDAMSIVVVTAWAAKFAHGFVVEEGVRALSFNAFLLSLGVFSFMQMRKRYELGAHLHNLELSNAYLKGLEDASMARTRWWRDRQEAREKAAEESSLAVKRDWETFAEPLLRAARQIMIFAKSYGRPGVDDTMAGVNRFCVDDEFRQEMLKWLKVHHMQCVLENRDLLASVERWEVFQTFPADTRAATTFTLNDMTTSKAA